jgi:hypothetical protein
MKRNRKYLTHITWGVIIFACAFTMDYLEDVYSGSLSLLFGILVTALFASYLFILVRTSKAYRRFRGDPSTQSDGTGNGARSAMDPAVDAERDINPPKPEIH